MNRIERDLRRAFPDHTVVKARKRNHYKIYDQAGCMVASTPGTPSEHHWMVNVRQEVRRHACPVPAPAI